MALMLGGFALMVFLVAFFYIDIIIFITYLNVRILQKAGFSGLRFLGWMIYSQVIMAFSMFIHSPYSFILQSVLQLLPIVVFAFSKWPAEEAAKAPADDASMQGAV